jgi:hypothetical protein
MELVHHDLVHPGIFPITQRNVGEHLGSAANDRSARVD